MLLIWRSCISTCVRRWNALEDMKTALRAHGAETGTLLTICVAKALACGPLVSVMSDSAVAAEAAQGTAWLAGPLLFAP